MTTDNNTIPSNVTHLSAVDRVRPTLHTPRPRPQFGDQRPQHNAEAPKRFVAKGHDSQLQDAQHGTFPTIVYFMSGGEQHGVIIRRDKFTITLRPKNSESEVIIYKHAIESIYITKPVAGAQ